MWWSAKLNQLPQVKINRFWWKREQTYWAKRNIERGTQKGLKGPMLEAKSNYYHVESGSDALAYWSKGFSGETSFHFHLLRKFED